MTSKPAASYQLRVNLYAEDGPLKAPTNKRIAEVVKRALVDELRVKEEDVTVTSERLDK